MKSEEIPDYRLGVVRVPGWAWLKHAEATKASLADGVIIDIEQVTTRSGARYLAKDVTLQHPDFEQLQSPEDELPYYKCDFKLSDDGSIQRGPFSKLEALFEE